ncbi:ubiquitin carboxyl-terminal hydrolase [Vairimorpha necatrix]|uniref:ubiquitinyl hydrolase 1 n=1 Tax=Vairimorpha necatrix TaxID=6039 RepID=A0AAX4JDI4_9MICR
MFKKNFAIQTIVFICLKNIIQTVEVFNVGTRNVVNPTTTNSEEQNSNTASSSNSSTLENEIYVIDGSDDTINEQNIAKICEENKYCGLYNLKYSCYANCILQSLIHIKRFREKIAECKEGEMILLLNEAIQEMQKNKIYNPKNLLDHIIKNYNILQDIHEFYLEFFAELTENKKGDTKISELDNLITGTTKETSKNEEGQIFERLNNFKNIFLPISTSDGAIIDNLEESLAQEFTNDGKSKKEIKKAPEILFLLINRFVFDKEKKKLKKYNGLFKFPKEIDFSPYCVDTTIENTYKLHSVIVHKGNSTFGHYYCNILIDGKWYEFNDYKNKMIGEKDAIEEQFGGHKEATNEMKNHSAYYLVYVKKN